MDTKQFLETILPADAVCIVATKAAKGFQHKGFTDFGEAAAYIAQCDETGIETYHACAGYERAPYLLNGKLITRTAMNWKSAKSFWCDIDCGEEKAAKGKGYATQREGATALMKWCNDRHFPLPLTVNSGNGIHAYWLLTEAIPAEQWRTLAAKLKTGMEADGLLVDPTRTADFSSILRPVGTHNHKAPDNPKEVKWTFGDSSLAISPKEMQALIEALSPEEAEDEDVEVSAEPQQREYSAELCADNCAQMAAMRDTQGDVDYETWRGVIGVIRHCTEGIELARKWSARRAETGHTQTDVDVKFNSWNAKPTTCEFFSSQCAERCANCPHNGKITSPIQLGVIEIKPAPVVIEATLEENNKTVKLEVPSSPRGFAWDEKAGAMIAYTKKQGVVTPVPFCRVRLFLCGRVRDANGEFYFVARAILPRNRVREFKLAGATIGGGLTKLLEELGKYEILVGNSTQAGGLMQTYLKEEVCRLMNTLEEVRTYSHFGWQRDWSFVVGTRRYTPDGDVTDVLLGDSAYEQHTAFPAPQGSVKAYAEHVNWIYNRDGMEAMQYLICSLWGAPLVEFMEPTYNGIPCALTGCDSGKGKTTAAQVALYAFGRAYPDLSLTGIRGSTAGGQAKFLGVLRSLPILFDEVTNKTSAQLSTLCYELSNGTEPMRLRAAGGQVRFAERASWRTQTAMTGNANIGAKLSANGNAEAEAMRVFEICTDNLPIPKLDPLETSRRVAEIARNAGAAGDLYVKWLVAHRTDEVQRIIGEVAEKVVIDKSLASQPKYRFYRNHMICTLTAAEIMHQLGVIAFDLDKLYRFAIVAVRECFAQVADLVSVGDPMDTLSEMLTAFGGRMVVTPTLDVEKGYEPYKLVCPQGLVGRAIHSNTAKKDTFDGTLYLSASAVSKWCAENRIPKRRLISDLTRMSVLRSAQARTSLGRGTNIVTAQQRCWELDITKFELPPTMEATNGDRSEQGPTDEDTSCEEIDG